METSAAAANRSSQDRGCSRIGGYSGVPTDTGRGETAMSDFGETTQPVARKDYRCEWCGETIQKGEKHAHFVGKWEGEFQDWRMHAECSVDADSEELMDGFMPYEHPRPSSFSDTGETK